MRMHEDIVYSSMHEDIVYSSMHEDIVYSSMREDGVVACMRIIINPRRACATRVTVVVLSFSLSVCLSVCHHVFCRY